MAPATFTNPLGRASLSKPVSAVLDRASAAIVAINHTAGGGSVVSHDRGRTMDIARRSFIGSPAIIPSAFKSGASEMLSVTGGLGLSRVSQTPGLKRGSGTHLAAVSEDKDNLPHRPPGAQ